MGRALAAVAAAAVALLLVPVTAGALVERPFAPRFTANEPGAIRVTGNTLMTCPAAAATCAASQAGTATGAALNNNGYAMVRVDVDGDPATFSSSNSTIIAPPAGEVLFAGLYFGGRVNAGTGGAPAPAPAARGSVLLRTPTTGGAYVPVAAAVTDSTAIAGTYVAFADVTALVAAGGSGRYWVANVQSGTGLDRYAGWSLVVVYRDATLPLRDLTVFDGLASIQQGDPPLSIPVSGFRTPLSGQVRSSVGIVAYEGDRGSAGARVSLNGRVLQDAANPPGNLLNSSVSFEGTDSIDIRTPGYVNQLGFDADRILADGFLGNGATSTSFEASTTLDQYLIQAVTFTTDLSSPRLELDKTVADLNGGAVEPGDRLRYSLVVRNAGDDGANGVLVSDGVPAGTGLVPGSLAGPGGSAAADKRSVAFGVGALAPGATAALGFTVTVDADAPDGFVVRNVAAAAGTGATLGRSVDATSPEVRSIVRLPPFSATFRTTPPPVAGEPTDALVTIANRLPGAAEHVIVTVALPGADLLTASGGCTVGQVIRCRVGRVEKGGRARVRLRLRARRPGAARPVVEVRADGIAARRLAVERLRVRPGPARLIVRARPLASLAARGQVVRYRLAVTAAVSGVAARGVRLCADPGAGLRPRSAGGGRFCWRLGTIAPGRTATRTVAARVEAGSGTVPVVARATAANVSPANARAAVARLRLVAALPVTG